MLERVRVAWRSVRPPDALAAGFLCLLLARKSRTADLEALVRPTLSSAAGSSPELAHVCDLIAAYTRASEGGINEEQQFNVAEVNSLQLVLLGLAELTRIRDVLQQPGCGALETVATRSPPYSILTSLRYLLAFVFPEQCVPITD